MSVECFILLKISLIKKNNLKNIHQYKKNLISVYDCSIHKYTEENFNKIAFFFTFSSLLIAYSGIGGGIFYIIILNWYDMNSYVSSHLTLGCCFNIEFFKPNRIIDTIISNNYFK